MTAATPSASPVTDRADNVQRTISWFILRGLAAGAIAGAIAALFVRFVTETQIGFALKFEEATGIGLPPGEPAEFSRSTQHWGGMAATLIFGIVMGLALGIAVAAVHHRVRARNEFGRAIRVATAAFVAITVIPGLKYPPNPPTVGNPDTIENRTTEYLLLMAASIAIVFLSWWLWERLTARGVDGAPRFALGGGAFVVLVTLAWLIWPASPDAIVPPDNDGTPALQIAEDAPPDVLAGMLDTARTMEDPAIRDPEAPDEPLDLDAVDDPNDLIGAPVAVNTTKLVPHAYTTVVWHFRVLSFAGLALLWAVMATAFGFLADRPAKRDREDPEPPPAEERVLVDA